MSNTTAPTAPTAPVAVLTIPSFTFTVTGTLESVWKHVNEAAVRDGFEKVTISGQL